MTNSTRHFSSLSIEENEQAFDRHSQKWLLTYLDVFILIIMLVVTLIAISDFKTEPKTSDVEHQKKQLKQTVSPKKEKPITTTNPIEKTTPIINPTQPPVTAKVTATAAESKNQIKPTPPVSAETIINKQALKSENIKQAQLEKNTELSDDILQEKLKKTIAELGLTKAVDMKIRQGYAQLEIQDNILFKSSEASLVIAGKGLLKQLTSLLEKSSGLIYIEGHTDNRPIKTARFPSNWELGAARATSVLHYLASQKLDATRLRAVTYGDTKPIADNKTKEGREKNRRVSLVIKVSDKID